MAIDDVLGGSRSKSVASRQLHVLLSHCQTDQAWVELTSLLVGTIGVISVALLEHDAEPGFATDIAAAAIGHADALIVLITCNGGVRQGVSEQVGVAQLLGTPVVPIVEAGVPPQELSTIQGINHINLIRNAPLSPVSTVLMQVHRIVEGQRRTEGVEVAESQLLQADRIEIAIAITLVTLLHFATTP